MLSRWPYVGIFFIKKVHHKGYLKKKIKKMKIRLKNVKKSNKNTLSLVFSDM